MQKQLNILTCLLAAFIILCLLLPVSAMAQKKNSNPMRKPIPTNEPPKILDNVGVDFDFRRSPMFQESGFRVREWNRVMMFESQNPTFDREIMHTTDTDLAAEWKRLYALLSYETTENKIRYVNRLFNLWPYKDDSANYGRSDYWASPREFIAKSGDCEDYAIIKYYAMRALGVSPRDLCIALVIVSDDSSGHAVLVVEDYDGFYILDNNSDAVVARNKSLAKYIPEFYINENGIWKHN